MNRLIEFMKAWWRGEKRVAPHGARGRVYERKDGGGPIQAVARFHGSIKARVYRAATGTWEDLGVISKPKKE